MLIENSWFENRYPGVACDVPSHAYTFPWAPNAEWPRLLAPAKDIMDYIDKVIDRCGLAKYINVNHQVAGCCWDDERGKWKVKVQTVEPKMDWSSTEPLKVLSEFEDECDVLLHATGLLNRWKYPEIPGLGDFKGRVSCSFPESGETWLTLLPRLSILLAGRTIMVRTNGRTRTW